MIESGHFSLLDEINSIELEEIPEEWKTTKQLAKEWKTSESNASRLVRKGVEKGVLKTRKFIIKTGSRTFPVPHYSHI
jgi:predicted transcriptional regulator